MAYLKLPVRHLGAAVFVMQSFTLWFCKFNWMIHQDGLVRDEDALFVSGITFLTPIVSGDFEMVKRKDVCSVKLALLSPFFARPRLTMVFLFWGS